MIVWNGIHSHPKSYAIIPWLSHDSIIWKVQPGDTNKNWGVVRWENQLER